MTELPEDPAKLTNFSRKKGKGAGEDIYKVRVVNLYWSVLHQKWYSMWEIARECKTSLESSRRKWSVLGTDGVLDKYHALGSEYGRKIYAEDRATMCIKEDIPCGNYRHCWLLHTNEVQRVDCSGYELSCASRRHTGTKAEVPNSPIRGGLPHMRTI